MALRLGPRIISRRRRQPLSALLRNLLVYFLEFLGRARLGDDSAIISLFGDSELLFGHLMGGGRRCEGVPSPLLGRRFMRGFFDSSLRSDLPSDFLRRAFASGFLRGAFARGLLHSRSSCHCAPQYLNGRDVHYSIFAKQSRDCSKIAVQSRAFQSHQRPIMLEAPLQRALQT
ncbi:hypothetical protein WOC76_20525 [Methylocystis sp. IM3]|uniref:hypothetical protein n=1 Tax=unclassified Methylocystis TaxID=2625913 RepID=UPI0030F8FE93